MNLPDEILLIIFKFLSVSDILNCRLTCSKFLSICYDKLLWKDRKVAKWTFDDVKTLQFATVINCIQFRYPNGFNLATIRKYQCTAKRIYFNVFGVKSYRYVLQLITILKALPKPNVVSIYIHHYSEDPYRQETKSVKRREFNCLINRLYLCNCHLVLKKSMKYDVLIYNKFQ